MIVIVFDASKNFVNLFVTLIPFVPNAPFLYPLKTSEKVFRGYRKDALGTNRL